MAKNMVYFVLYMILLSELLIVITERDEYEEKEAEVKIKMLSSIAASYQNPILLNMTPNNFEYATGSTNPAEVSLTALGLANMQEREAVEYYLDIAPGSPKPPNWPDGGISDKKGTADYRINKLADGNATFFGRFNKPADYEFLGYCRVERKLPDYLPDFYLDELKQLIGELKTAESPKSNLKIDVIRKITERGYDTAPPIIYE